MKIIIVFLILFPLIGYSQEYVDLLKIGYGQTLNNDFESDQGSTNLKSFDLDLTIPVILNQRLFLVTGVTYSQNSLQLFPDSGITKSEFYSLYSTSLKIGVSSIFNDIWSGTIVLLPKLASDYEEISKDDFYFGGIAFFDIQKKKNLKYIFGLYISEEAFGYFSTPIIGWNYISDNKKIEMAIWFPILANINYTKGAFTYGVHYIGLGRSHNITKVNTNEYVALGSLECTGYVQLNTWNKSVLLRAKFGYAINDYEVYNKGDNIRIGFPGFSLGDNRYQLNPNIKGGFLLKIEAIYRFHLAKMRQ